MTKLPDLLCFDDFGGDWEKYLEALYLCFKKDFFEDKILFDKLQVKCIRDPYLKGKEYTFWHMISGGEVEEERTPDLRRCERLKWPKAIIENYPCGDIKLWETERKNKKGKIQKRICFCFGKWDYIVIITKRKDYYLFCTAFPIDKYNKKRYKKEFEKYNKQTPPLGAVSDTPSTHGR